MKPIECSFCQRQGERFRARIFGPCSVAICEDCVRTLEPHALEGAATLPARTFEVTAEWLAHYGGGKTLGPDERPPAAAPDGRSFCGLAPDEVAHLFGSRCGPSRICDACIRLAIDLLVEEGA